MGYYLNFDFLYLLLERVLYRLHSALDSGVGGLEDVDDFVGALISDSSSSNNSTPCKK